MVLELGLYSPPGQSFLHVEKGLTLKSGSQSSFSGSKSWSQSSCPGSQFAIQCPYVSSRDSSKWLISVPGNFVVMFLTGHLKTGYTKFSSSKRMHSL